ncbi:extracellular solute-binding protein [Roseibium salinum]|nr:extracellular solute-binding protein [Roseibium salinum]
MLDQMLAQALVIHRGDSARRERVDLRDIALDLFEEGDHAVLYPDTDVMLEIGEVPVRVLADELSLKEALKNLLGNALRYGRSPVRVGASLEKGKAAIWVEDSGSGPGEEILAGIGARFNKGVLSRQTGSGLGLAIAHSVAVSFGGNLVLEKHLREPVPGGTGLRSPCGESFMRMLAAPFRGLFACAVFLLSGGLCAAQEIIETFGSEKRAADGSAEVDDRHCRFRPRGGSFPEIETGYPAALRAVGVERPLRTDPHRVSRRGDRGRYRRQFGRPPDGAAGQRSLRRPPYRSRLTGQLPDALSWRDELWGITREPAVIVYNRDLVPPGDVPRTRFDLLDLLRPFDTPYAGRIATYDIEESGLGYLFAFADAQEASTFGALQESFGRSRTVSTCCSAEIIQGVAEGRYLMAYNVLGSYAQDFQQRDERIGIVLPSDYTLVLSRALMIPKQAKNKLPAKEFLDFLLSPEGTFELQKALLISPPCWKRRKAPRAKA